MIARYYGAKEYDGLRTAVHTTLAFGLAAGILLTVLGMTLTPQLLALMRTDPDVMENSVAYFRMYFAGAIAIVMYNLCVGILQAVGDSRHPLYYLILSSIINVALDLLFVGVFRWGVWSVAFATTIAQFVSLGLCLYRLCHYETVYQVHLSKIRFDLPMLKQVVRFGLPSGVQNSIIAFANVVVQSNINAFGANAMAELIGVTLFVLAEPLVALFQGDAGVIAIGVKQARMEALFYCFLAFSHCIAGIMRGAGKPTVPMFVMLAIWCVLRVTYISIVVPLFGRIEVVFSAYPLTWFLSSIVFLIYFLKSDWLHNYDRMKQKGALT